MKILSCSLNLFALILVSSSAMANTFMRIESDDVQGSVQSAVKTYALASGHKVTLLGSVHVGEEDYFAGLQDILDGASHVLYELNGYNGIQEKNELRKIDACRKQFALAGFTLIAEIYLKLRSQFDAIQYRESFIHADMTSFEDPSEVRGQKFVGLPRSEQACKAILDSLAGYLKSIGVQASIDYPEEVKREWSQQPSVTGLNLDLERLETAKNAIAPDVSMLAKMKCDERSEIAFDKLVKTLEQASSPANIVILYGPSHMPYLEGRIQADLGGQLISEQWLKAWKWAVKAAEPQNTEL